MQLAFCQENQGDANIKTTTKQELFFMALCVINDHIQKHYRSLKLI